MLVFVLAIAVVAVLISLASLAFGRGRRFDDVERFHRARAMTTAWSRAGVTQPVIGAQPAPEEERESAQA